MQIKGYFLQNHWLYSSKMPISQRQGKTEDSFLIKEDSQEPRTKYGCELDCIPDQGLKNATVGSTGKMFTL